MRLHYDRSVNLSKLHDEILTAVPSLRAQVGPDGRLHAVMEITGTDTSVDLFVPDDLSTADQSAIAAVVAAHDPTPPRTMFDRLTISNQIRTTTATPAEVARYTVPVTTGFAGLLDLIAVDAGNGALKVIRASFAVKRLNAGALAVGAPVVIASHADAAASAWTVTPSLDGNDIVISVTGAAGRTIDWRIDGEITRFAPGGLP